MRTKRIPSLQKYRGRAPNGLFDALPLDARKNARAWLYRFCKRWGNNLPTWRYAILVGVAKRLAMNPPDSAWGRKMLAKRGGLEVQKEYRFRGRNPTAKATAARRSKAVKVVKAGEDSRLGRILFSLSSDIMPVPKGRPDERGKNKK